MTNLLREDVNKLVMRREMKLCVNVVQVSFSTKTERNATKVILSISTNMMDPFSY